MHLAEDPTRLSLEERNITESFNAELFLVFFKKRFVSFAHFRTFANVASEEHFPTTVPSQVYDLRPPEQFDIFKRQTDKLFCTF